jgi:protein-disulfide isomerase
MNKRDEQRRRREEKQRAAEKSQGTRKLLSRFGLFFVLPVIALITVYTLLNQAPTYSPIQIAENDHLRGNREAPVTIVVYADFQCPACATEHETMMRLWPEINEDAHLIFRTFPYHRSTPQYMDRLSLRRGGGTPRSILGNA